MLRFKNDSGPVAFFSDAVAAVIPETRGVQRVWFTGGGSVTVHAGFEELVSAIETARVKESY